MGIHKVFWKLAWPAAAEGLLLMLLTAADLLMVSALGDHSSGGGRYFFAAPYGDPLSDPILFCCIERLCGSSARTEPGLSADRLCKGFPDSVSLHFFFLHGSALFRFYGMLERWPWRFSIGNLGFSGPAIVLHGVLIGVGDTRSVLIANVIGNRVNVALNVLLIHGVGPCPSSGVLGSGISTAIVPA